MKCVLHTCSEKAIHFHVWVDQYRLRYRQEYSCRLTHRCDKHPLDESSQEVSEEVSEEEYMVTQVMQS